MDFGKLSMDAGKLRTDAEKLSMDAGKLRTDAELLSPFSTNGPVSSLNRPYTTG